MVRFGSMPFCGVVALCKVLKKMHEEQIFITPAVINQRLRRNIRSGDGYTAFMPFSDCSSKRMLGYGDTSFAIDNMAKTAQEYQHQTQALTQHFFSRYPLGDTLKKAINDFLYWHIQYSIDGDAQLLRSPACSWASRYEGVDCKSYSIFASCILLNLGISHYMRRDNVLKKKVKIEKEPTVKQTDGLAAPTAQSSETIAFNKEILKAKRDGFNTDKVLKLGKAKGELKKIVGDKEMRISQATIKKAMTKDDSHIITWENLINLPDYLNNPLAIFKSKTAGFVVLTEIINAKNKPVIAPLHIVTKGNYIEVKSLYSRKNDSTYQNWVKEDLLLYINKKSDLAFKTMGTIPNLDSKSQDKNTKKSVSGKKTAENFGLGLPLTDEIRKKAFTDKGKLRKGWYYEENGILTNGKYFYIPKDKKQIEYQLLKEKVLDKISQKQKIKSELNDLESDAKGKNDYKLNWLNDGYSRMDFYQSLLPKLKETISNIEKEAVWEIVENSVADGKNGNRAFTWNGKKSKEYQVFLKRFGIKDGKAYLLNEDALFVYHFVKEAIKKEISKVRGDREKLEKKYGLAAPVPVVETTQEPISSESAGPQVFVEESLLTPEGETYQTESVNPLPAVAHHRKGSLAEQLANAPTQTESYQIDRVDMAQFLGSFYCVTYLTQMRGKNKYIYLNIKILKRFFLFSSSNS